MLYLVPQQTLHSGLAVRFTAQEVGSLTLVACCISSCPVRCDGLSSQQLWFPSWADCFFTMVVLRPTQPSIRLGLVNEDQPRLGRQRQVWFIPFVDKCGCAGRTVWSLENACHTWVPLWWSWPLKRHYIKCHLPLQQSSSFSTMWCCVGVNRISISWTI